MIEHGVCCGHWNLVACAHAIITKTQARPMLTPARPKAAQPKPPSIVSRRRSAAAVLGVLVLYVPAAHAYLDPGTGSVILQVLLGGLAGLAVAIKLFWHRLVMFFVPSRRRAVDEVVDEDRHEGDDPERPS